MASYRFTPTARRGYEQILEYVERQFGPRVARRVLERMESAFAQLAESPGLGHVRDDLTADRRIRFWSVAPSLIAYQQRGPDEIVILFVERAERDWRSLLE